MPGTGMNVVPKLPKRPAPVFMSFRTYRSIWYRHGSLHRYWQYRCPYRTNVPRCSIPVLVRTELTEMCATGIDVVPNLSVGYRFWYRTELPEVSGTGSDIELNIPKWYWCRAENTDVSGTGIDAVPNLQKSPVPVITSYRTYRSVLHRYQCRTDTCTGTGTGTVTDLGKYAGGIHTEHFRYFTAVPA